MKASEAKELSDLYEIKQKEALDYDRNELDKIMSEIKSSAEGGYYDLQKYRYLSDGIKYQLQKLGYRITESAPTQGKVTFIEWK